MAWRFVAEDGDFQADVPEGTTVIGRGSFLQISDKHVSRQHAEVKVEDGKCQIRSTHSNPCFYKPRDGTIFNPLTNSEWNDIQDRDSIALAPNQHRFRLVWGESKVERVAPAEPSADEAVAAAQGAAVEESDQQISDKPKVEVEKLASGGEDLLLSSTAAPAQPDYVGEAQGAEYEAKRTPCQYGGSCYKKNPIHFKEYCHPGDADYPNHTDVTRPVAIQQPARQQRQPKRAAPRAKSEQKKTGSGRPMRQAAAKRVKASALEGGDSDEFNFSDEGDFSESSESEGYAPGGSDDDWRPGKEDDGDDDYRDQVIDDGDDGDEFIPGRSHTRKRTRTSRR